MGKAYYFISAERKKAISTGNEFMRRARALKRRARYFGSPYIGKAGRWICAIDVCGTDFRDLDTIAERLKSEL